MRRVLMTDGCLYTTMLSQESETFHVVCHDCEFESLEADSGDASRLADDHAAQTNHSTRYARIQ